MPPYPWMLEAPLDLSNSSDKLRLMTKLNVPYSASQVFHAEKAAREQAEQIAKEIEEQRGPAGLSDKQIVALIAYLQRLGTDIEKPPQHTVPMVADQR